MSTVDDRAEKYGNDPRPTEELIGLALAKDADADNDEYWHPIWILQHRMPQILERIKELSESPDEKSRDTAATILGQNGVRNKVAESTCLDRLLGMVPEERSPKVLSSIAFACGQFHHPRCIEPLLRLTQHPNADVRYAVVDALSGHEDDQAIRALIGLSADADSSVRNWATFGLGSQIDADTPEIRDALFARLQEPESEIRGEALVGLAQRGDKRVIAALLKELESESPDVLRDWVLVGDAATSVIRVAIETGEGVWHPVLEKIKALGISDAAEVTAAIERCGTRSK